MLMEINKMCDERTYGRSHRQLYARSLGSLQSVYCCPHNITNVRVTNEIKICLKR